MKSQKLPQPGSEQQVVNVARRHMLLATAPLLLGLASQGNAAEVLSCFDPEALPSNQKSMRRSLGFKLATSDAQNCGLCAFFTPSAGGCGNCAMLSGGVVATAYVCESWAAKT